MTRPRAAIVATGSELVRGERQDLNGPFYAREGLALGLQPVSITIVGDDPHELEQVLRRQLADADVCLVSGGLGPTHDDRTVELVAKVAGAALVVDDALEREIETFSRGVAERLRRPYADFAGGVRKQATIPAGAHVLGLAGTAPGLVVETPGCPVVVLPGPPGELRRLWPRALETPPLRAVLARVRAPERRTLRFYGASESAAAKALEELGGDGDGVEVTICARDFEIHVDVVVEPDDAARARADRLGEGLAEALRRYLFATDERGIEAHVLDLCRERGLRLATAESCTGGLVAARLTDEPGASDVFLGGVVAYANEVKERELGVPAALLERHGAVSAEVAEAMAEGARERLGAEVAVAVTGVAGPGGGTAAKPVGLVHLHAAGAGRRERLTFELPAERDWIRRRSAVAALHLVRRLLVNDRHEHD